MQRELVLAAGKDPIQETGGGGGHSGYVRMWARAACQVGYSPHIFCISRSTEDVATPYGIVHRIRSPLSWLPDRHHTGFRTNTAALHYGIISRRVVRHVLAAGHTRVILHGFGIWSDIVLRSATALRRAGLDCRTVAAVYTTQSHEYAAKWRGLRGFHGIDAWLHSISELVADALFMERAERRSYLRSDCVILHYESVRRLFLERWGPRKGPIVKPPYASEVSFLTGGRQDPPTSIPEHVASLPRPEAPLIVSVSRHDPRKGLDILIRALGLLRDRGVAFRACLVGSGNLLQSHRRLSESLGLGGAVALPGFVGEVSPYLLAADVFVLPSLQEGSGSMSMLEAMQYGRAIVASGIDGIPEDVADRRSGLLAPAGDPQALADRIGELIASRDLRATLGSEARRVYEARFSPDAVVRAIPGIYGGLD